MMRNFLYGFLSLAIVSMLVFTFIILTHPAIKLLADGVIPVR